MMKYRRRIADNLIKDKLEAMGAILIEGPKACGQDMDYFRNFTLDPFTVDWNNEIGFAPQYLYERSALA